MRSCPLTMLGLVLVLGSSALAQEVDLAERLLRSGERAYQAKSHAEALETWSQLLAQAPTSPQAADALLRMARHQAEVEKKPEAALALLDKLRTEHLKSPSAPEGLLFRGQLLAQRALRPSDLKEAVAEFNRLLDLFPEHAAVPEAHLALGQAYADQGLLGQALVHFTEVRRWDPASAEAARAMLLAAEVLDQAGDLQGCLRTLQSLTERFPGTPSGEEAAWRLLVRVKHRLLKPPLKSQGPWPEGRQKWLKTPTLMVMGAEGEPILYQDDLDQAFRLEQNRLVPLGPPVKNARALFVAPGGQLGLVSSKGIVHREEGASMPLPSLGSPTGAFLDRWGHLWISDAKAGALTVLQTDGTPRTVPSPGLTAMAPLPGGAIFAASDANRTLYLMDAAGQPKTTLTYGKDLPTPFKYVLAMASDPAGHVVALVDGGDFEGVVLWGPQGQLLRFATYKQLGLSGRFRAVALDRKGGILLADRSNDLIVRLD